MDTAELLKVLNRRRHDLRMPISAIARRSRVHPSSVNRLLAGDLSVAGFGTVCRVAAALGVEIRMHEIPVPVMRQRAARAVAARIVKSVQATSALEAQAVGPGILRAIQQRIIAQLLAGPGYRLWAE